MAGLTEEKPPYPPDEVLRCHEKAASLDNGATVSGNPYKSLGVPFTEADVSIRWKSYSYGP